MSVDIGRSLSELLFLGGCVNVRGLTLDGRPVPLIVQSRCDGCGHCVKVCPTHALSIENGKAIVSDPLGCDYHGFCERVCPKDAIQRPFEIVMAK